MSWFKSKTLGVAVATLCVAAMLGGTLGIAMAAHTQSLGSGFNLVGGPLAADTPPNDFMACLPQNSWTSVYIWDAANQEWKHYFNTAAGVPGYINAPETGGIVIVPRLAGVAVMTTQAVPNAKFKDAPTDSC